MNKTPKTNRHRLTEQEVADISDGIKKGMTDKAIAEITGFHVTTIGRIRRGVHSRVLKALASPPGVIERTLFQLEQVPEFASLEKFLLEMLNAVRTAREANDQIARLTAHNMELQASRDKWAKFAGKLNDDITKLSQEVR